VQEDAREDLSMTYGSRRFADVCLVGAVLAVPLFPRAVLAQETAVDNCLTCHSALDDETLSAPTRAFREDVHGTSGLSCASCHGGDPAAVGFEGMNPATGFVGRPARRELSDFCGRCHSDAQFMRQYNPSLRVDQVAEYITSVHGMRLMQQNDTAVAVCTSCHPAHSIRPPSNPLSSVNPLNVATTCSTCHADAAYMSSYGISTDQLEDYERSIHWEMITVGGDLSAPTCNDCHGNHGATPPGITSVGNVCGQCHSVMADNFALSRHASTFALIGMPGCAACHQNHEIVQANEELLGMSDGAVCVRCHSSDDPGGVVAVSMRSQIDSLMFSFAEADSILQQAERAGMEVSEALFELGIANNSMVEARAAVHAANMGAVAERVSEGLEITLQARETGESALAELGFRRTGLAVSVTIILAMIAGLILKIREIENR
jgi:predicted CXXCH cytochrome family protein